MAYFPNGRSTTSYLGNLFWSKNKVQIFLGGGLEAKMMLVGNHAWPKLSGLAFYIYSHYIIFICIYLYLSRPMGHWENLGEYLDLC